MFSNAVQQLSEHNRNIDVLSTAFKNLSKVKMMQFQHQKHHTETEENDTLGPSVFKTVQQAIKQSAELSFALYWLSGHLVHCLQEVTILCTMHHSL